MSEQQRQRAIANASPFNTFEDFCQNISNFTPCTLRYFAPFYYDGAAGNPTRPNRVLEVRTLDGRSHYPGDSAHDMEVPRGAAGSFQVYDHDEGGNPQRVSKRRVERDAEEYLDGKGRPAGHQWVGSKLGIIDFFSAVRRHGDGGGGGGMFDSDSGGGGEDAKAAVRQQGRQFAHALAEAGGHAECARVLAQAAAAAASGGAGDG